ncbi:MAG: hypothetical protein HY670_09760 [Chloroflexi bacterium]|nr:hypothetical protein [Chloroflexota bacterium]
MDVELEKLIDEVWNLSLARISKKEVPTARPALGDEIDLYVPQTRVLLLMETNPAVASLVYSSAYISANRNTYNIMKKLGMPADYFWKFEYWMKQRAYDTLRRVINRVFTAMMNLNKEGGLDVTDVDVEHLRFALTFKDCVECAGITAQRGICYYHSATFAGIIAALINKEMDAWEDKCQAGGDHDCIIHVGKRGDPEVVAKMTTYLTPPKMIVRLDDRLNGRLKGSALRSIGNLVNVEYYQLVVANAGLNDPTLFASTSFDVGVAYGTKLAPILTGFYQDNQLSVLKKYFNQLRELDVSAVEVGNDIDVMLTDCPELSNIIKKKELLGFLLGELQGLIATLLNRKLVYKDSHIEGTSLKVKLSPQA